MKTELMREHEKLIHTGNYDVARVLLEFLIKHRITLGMGDTDWTLDGLLEKHNVKCVFINHIWVEYVY